MVQRTCGHVMRQQLLEVFGRGMKRGTVPQRNMTDDAEDTHTDSESCDFDNKESLSETCQTSHV